MGPEILFISECIKYIYSEFVELTSKNKSEVKLFGLEKK